MSIRIGGESGLVVGKNGNL